MMKKPFQYIIVIFFSISMILASCSSSGRMGGSKKGCGCGTNKGFVGY